MCQLLGLNSNLATDICFSFTGFRHRGGITDQHVDGWGIAFFDGGAARVFHDPQPSCSSPLAAFLSAQPIRSTNIIAHIRKATRGRTHLRNTHPFVRELWGRHWVFAHNGTLKDFAPSLDGSYLPVGETDSELAFCWLLQQLRARFGAESPAPEAVFAFLREMALELSRYGICNFLLSCGDSLFAHCSTRLGYLERRSPFAGARLLDVDLAIEPAAANPAIVTALVATTPLTADEAWQGMPPGSLWWFVDGAVRGRLETVAGVVDQAAPHP